MSKVCYICGVIIPDHTMYYSAGPHSYVCGKDECWHKHFWDKNAARFVVDRYHEYVVTDGKVYRIGSEYDEPRGMGGRHWVVGFFDGMHIHTDSLWLVGTIPEEYKEVFKENATLKEII